MSDSTEKKELSVKPAAEPADNLPESAIKPDAPPAGEENRSAFAKAIDKTSQVIDSIRWDRLIMRVLASLFAVSAVIYCRFLFADSVVKFSSLDYVRQVDVKSVLIGMAAVFAIISIVSNLLRRINVDAYAISITMLCYTFMTLWKNDNFYYVFGVIVALSVLGFYLLKNDCLKELYKIRGWWAFGIILVGSLIMCAFVAVFCVMRYRIYYSSTFDMGIAAQMYYYMKETFAPLTTCERDTLLSHFAVHFTPVYYLLLPVYFIFPYLETLLISQPIILALGVIPLYFMCKHNNFKPVEATCISLGYIFSCAIIAPCFYDFHENAFIPVLMLSFFYFLEKRNWKWMYVFLILTLGVKEDVSVSMCCVGMYMLFSNKENKNVKLHGFIVAAVSAFYFLLVTSLLAKYGEGTFSHRFNSLMAEPNNGLSEIFRTAIADPAFMLSMAFNEEKFIFFMQMFMPLAFVPFLSKKGGRFMLLVPTFLVCMLPDYPYQHNIDFQYVFGMIPMLFYLVVINSKDLGAKVRKYVFPFIAVASIALSFSHMTGKVFYIRASEMDRNKITAYENYLSMIPEEASVECTHIFVPRLASRRELYTIPDDQSKVKWEPCDYVVITVGSNQKSFTDEKVNYLLSHGYSYAFGNPSYIAVYHRDGAEY